jgi:streptogramin lyase
MIRCIAFIGAFVILQAASAAAAPGVHSVPLTARAGNANWKTLPRPRNDGLYNGITRGGAGLMWVADTLHGLERVEASGKRTDVSLRFDSGGHSHAFFPAYLAAGPGGALYMTGCVDGQSACGFIGVRKPNGYFSATPIPSGESARFSGIVQGPDGAFWFTDAGNVGRIDASGIITEYPYGTGETANEFTGIAVSADNKIWFTELDRKAVANIDPVSKSVTEFGSATQDKNCGLAGMAALGKDMYFGCEANGVLAFFAMTTLGAATEYDTGYFYSNGPQEIIADGGTLWLMSPQAVQSFVPATQVLTTYPPPQNETAMYGSAVGPGDEPWLLSEDGTIFVLPAQ